MQILGISEIRRDFTDDSSHRQFDSLCNINPFNEDQWKVEVEEEKEEE